MFRHPYAWLGLLTAVAPIIIHLLVRARARPLAFPSLRFVPASRLSAVRARAPRDWALMAVRVFIAAAAVVALADPVLVTPARRAAWAGRVARAIVIDASGSMRSAEAGTTAADRLPLLRADSRARALAEGAFTSTTIDAPRIGEGISRAVAWLDASPPASRELIVLSDVHEGSIRSADFAGIPPAIGIRIVAVTVDVAGAVVLGPAAIERIDGVTSARTPQVALRPDLTQAWFETQTDGSPGAPAVAGAPVLDVPRLGLRVAAGAGDAAAASAALTAALEVGLPLEGAQGERVVVVFPGAEDRRTIVRGGKRPSRPWMTSRIRRLVDDAVLNDAARVAVTVGEQATNEQTDVSDVLVNGAGDVVLQAAAVPARERGAEDLALIARFAPSSFTAAALLRAAARSAASGRWLQEDEPALIPRSTLDRWERPAAPLPDESLRNADTRDARLMWALALALLALELWIRRPRSGAQSASPATTDHAA